MSLKNLTAEQLALKDQLLENFDQIQLMVIVIPTGGVAHQIHAPRVHSFNPEDCSFRICLPNHHFADVLLQHITEVRLCG